MKQILFIFSGNVDNVLYLLYLTHIYIQARVFT